MPAPDSSPQLDLFEARQDGPRRRVGRKAHVPTLEQLLLANEMKASGATWPDITRALGVSKSTLARHYFPSDGANPPKGRRRHTPTPARRRIVRRATLGGMRPADVAKLIGISVPTLRLHYRDELQP